MFESMGRVQQMSAAKVVEAVAQFENFPPPKIDGDEPKVLIPDLFAKATDGKEAGIMPSLERLIENTKERGFKHTPYFTGQARNKISKSFALGVIMLTKYRPFFPVWIGDPRICPSDRTERLRDRFYGGNDNDFNLAKDCTRIGMKFGAPVEDSRRNY